MFKKLNRQSILPIVLMLLGLALILWSVRWFMEADSNSTAQAYSVSSSTSSARSPLPNIRRVSLLEAKEAHDSGSAVFVDVRGDQYHALEHITGALSIAEDEIESRLDELDPSAWIITYCT